MLDTEFLAAALTEQSQQMVDLTRGADLEQQVPSCPDWSLRQLLQHVGQAHRFGADIVQRRIEDVSQLSGQDQFALPDDATLSQWLTAGAHDLVETIRDVGADFPVWNWTGEDFRAAFWLRRMAHETAVHRCDAALTLQASCYIDAGLAADGISEWLHIVTSPDVIAANPDTVEALRGHGQTLHLHATDAVDDGSGEWLIRRGPNAVTWHHGHQKADVAVRGAAGDLLLALLGRIRTDDERIIVTGDTGLFQHWVQHVTF